MIRLLLRLVLVVAVAVLVFRLLARLLGGGPPAGRAGRSAARGETRGGTMQRDPVCGTYVAPELSLRAEGTDGPVYFCSEKCRQAYQARAARAS